MSVLELLKEEKVIWFNETEFWKSRDAIKYFYENISMIPDEKNYKVVDITTRNNIGTLDEAFVASYIEPYAKFIVKGSSWRVVEIHEEEIFRGVIVKAVLQGNGEQIFFEVHGFRPEDATVHL